MDTVITVALFALGLLLIIKGGDWFVDAAVWIANATGIPKFIIGATVVSLATTLPELTVSVTGVIDGELDMAVGNAIGSVTANIGLIMGISLVCLPAVIKRSQFWPKAVLMVAASALLWLTCSGGELTLTEGLLLLVIFALFIYDNIRSAKQNISSEERESVDKKALPKMLLLFVLGIAAIVVGSQFHRLWLQDRGSARRAIGNNRRNDGCHRNLASGACDNDHGDCEEGIVHVHRQHHRRERHRPYADTADMLHGRRRRAEDCRAVLCFGYARVPRRGASGDTSPAHHRKAAPLAGRAAAPVLCGVCRGACNSIRRINNNRQ